MTRPPPSTPPPPFVHRETELNKLRTSPQTIPLKGSDVNQCAAEGPPPSVCERRERRFSLSEIKKSRVSLVWKKKYLNRNAESVVAPLKMGFLLNATPFAILF